jgi:hypothetical protein
MRRRATTLGPRFRGDDTEGCHSPLREDDAEGCHSLLREDDTEGCVIPAQAGIQGLLSRTWNDTGSRSALRASRTSTVEPACNDAAVPNAGEIAFIAHNAFISYIH